MWSRSAFGLDVRIGNGPVVVFAPHGGRRERPIRRGDGVNDLYTAEIARELADALGAHALVNPTLDRNVADLNRVSALSSTAEPALLQLRAVVERAASGGAVPLVLVVHGWNVTMPACDIGIGLTTRRGRDDARNDEVRGTYPTISRATREGFVTALIAALEAREIDAPLGLRYPASGRDNATQLFSGRHAEHAHADVAALSRAAASGAIDAVQLELAIPLRWPGPYRERFMEAVVGVVGSEIERRDGGVRGVTAARSPRSEWVIEARRSSRGAVGRPKLPPGWSLQAVLPDGSGLFGGAEPAGMNEAAARLCIARSDGRMLLFVGEDEWAGDERAFRVGGLQLDAVSAGGGTSGLVRLTYDGPMVIYPSHDAFCDLETGLVGSELTAGSADLVFEPRDGAFGRLSGSIVCGEEHIGVDVLAVCERGSRRGGTTCARSRVFVTHGPVGPIALSTGLGGSGGCDLPRCECRIDEEGEVGGIGCFFEDGIAKDARVVTRVPVYRMLTEQVVVKVTFGTAELAHPGGEVSLALFEHVELIPQR